ncbi:hypothetical protein [uncultured Methanolobus sp.]|uniref:hypothetical protein n=1 Tax=uncultured Methanolobus sp. TaxID=218300 RepID=UPI0029C620D5|nr:hypothetical protein [uncultured Methanolobus sp.]
MSKSNKRKPKAKTSSKEFLVATKYPQNYQIFDIRSSKPLCYKDSSKEDASMVLQEIDLASINYSGKKVQIDYFPPNNVGLLLSISSKAMHMAKKLYDEGMLIQNKDDAKTRIVSKKDEIAANSRIIYDYIEMIQTCIVFGYTALEAFTNLSIPDDYEYKTKPNGKGIIEIYDKEAIERWTTLKIKISEILVDVYKTKNIKSLKIWTNLVQFEKMRHEIIHQKTIDNTDFYKQYFHEKVFELCKTPMEIIGFFFENRENKDFTNPLWPWVINSKNDFPVSYEYNANHFEVIGNIHEGRKK